MKATKEIEGALVDAALEKNGLTISGPPATRIDRLKKHYATYPDHELADCSECGHASPADDPACAFCGHAGEGAAEPETMIVPAAEVSKTLGDRAEAERQLDAAIGRYASAGRKMLGSSWDMGNAVREIRDGKLYLARRGAGDQPVHRNFEEFCRRELRTSAGHVNRLIAVAENYTREQALAVGTTKLGLTLKVFDAEKRAPLLEMASDPNVTVRQLAEATREAVKDQAPRLDRLGRRSGGAKAARKATAPVFPPAAPFLAKPTSEPVAEEDAPKPRRRLTLAAEEGDAQVLFYSRRKTPGDRRRAFELTDGPVGRFRFLNGTQMRIRLFKGEKGIYAKVEFGEAPDEEVEG